MSTLSQQDIDRINVNLETAQIPWRELQRFFASGSAIFVSEGLDLVEVAVQISKDNREQVAQWMDSRQIARVSDAQALEWYEGDADVWAVVVRPYVLVQPGKAS